MRYMDTVDLWDSNTAYLVRTGQIKLQAGQWVRCGSEKPSRFVKMQEGGVIVAAHPEGGTTTKRFETLCRIYLTSQESVV